jgi:3-(methylthio)propanoyl-CoA dehydrogenase
LISEQKILTKSADPAFYAAKITTARFFADHVLSQAPGLAATVAQGASSVMTLPEDQFLAA